MFFSLLFFCFFSPLLSLPPPPIHKHRPPHVQTEGHGEARERGAGAGAARQPTEGTQVGTGERGQVFAIRSGPQHTERGEGEGAVPEAGALPGVIEADLITGVHTYIHASIHRCIYACVYIFI